MSQKEMKAYAIYMRKAAGHYKEYDSAVGKALRSLGGTLSALESASAFVGEKDVERAQAKLKGFAAKVHALVMELDEANYGELFKDVADSAEQE